MGTAGVSVNVDNVECQLIALLLTCGEGQTYKGIIILWHYRDFTHVNLLLSFIKYTSTFEESFTEKMGNYI